MSQPPDIAQKIKEIEGLLPEAMHADRQAAVRQIKRIRRKKGAVSNERKTFHRLTELENRLQHAIQRKAQRKKNRPAPSYPEHLPITAKKDAIISAITHYQVIIVSGETGSGKTTQLPKFCLEAGRGVEGIIGCTQPRRIAAVTVAHRIAEELGEPVGGSAGYQIRFQDQFNRENGLVKIMTDGILLAETQGDKYLNEYDTIIVDEAHERGLNIDFLLGILRNLTKIRRDLKLIITSATIDTEKFSKAFDNAPVIEVSGRTYPVTVQYTAADSEQTAEELTYIEKAVDAVDAVFTERKPGDILVFMPTEQDIRETCEILEGRQYRHTTILPLFARLSAAAQMRVFKPIAGRKIVVATNVAETSITVPGIKYVVDSGLARISQYDPRSRTTSLPISPISKSSADQRKGRCGRVEDGICIRLYSEFDFESRPLFTPPEIQRSNLSEVILRMISLGLGAIQSFPFIDPPPAKQIKDGFDLLYELGVIERPSGKNARKSAGKEQPRLTRRGRKMAGIPLDPRLSRMLIEAAEEGCLEEVVVIVSALTIMDPRDRPEGSEKAAEAAHNRFKDPSSDFITWILIWRACFGEPAMERAFVKARDLKQFCRENFFSFRRMREWQDVHEQITAILKEAGIGSKKTGRTEKPEPGNEDYPPRYAAIHQSILSGFLSNIAVKKEKNVYQAAKNREMMIFPGSGVFNRGGRWIVSAEMVETSRLFGRNVANIDPAWLEPIGASLCRYTYLNPRWEKKQEAVLADEQVSLFGLIIEAGRPKRYGPIDPEGAADIFIREALIGGRVKTELPFMHHNWSQVEAVRDMENRFRRRDLLVDETKICEFYRRRLKHVYDMAGLKKRIKKMGSDRLLRMDRSDLLNYQPDDESLELFPDAMALGKSRYECDYRFDPGTAADGVTVKLPASAASAVSREATDWIVPGLLEEKIAGLLRALPKTHRKQLVPINDTVRLIMDEMPKYQGSLLATLSRFIFERFGVDIPASEWRESELPPYLRLRFAITDADGEEIDGSRDKQVLLARASEEVDVDGLSAEKKRWEKSGMTAWEVPDLPESIEVSGTGKTGFPVYPALVPAGDGVDLRLFQDAGAAIRSHKAGVARLFRLYFAKDLKFLKKTVALPSALKEPAGYFGGLQPVENRMVDRVINDLFYCDIRTEADFYAHARSQADKLLPAGRALMEAVVAVIEAYAGVRQSIYKLESDHSAKPLVLTFLSELRRSLTRLVPENFMEIYGHDRLGHLPRYLKAIQRRAERGMMDLDKDQRKAEQVKPFSDQLNGFLNDLDAYTSDEKRHAIEAFYWMIEELKVSLFAQELKTPYPVSAKKLKNKAEQIRRMV
ncbi:MAG: ATP-dependent RNA helicase HrpA [Desulfobacterales bacterium]|nr:ATP-dependent RNA helicase HrpA [Desulfobacterales bacterium]